MSVEPKLSEVKGRTYNATNRRDQAQQRRLNVLEVARAAFLRDGYAATTVPAIAKAAGVSVDTIYKSHGGKPGLVRALRDQALKGTEPIPAELRSDSLRDTAEDGHSLVRGWAELIAEVAPRVMPILVLIRAAGGADPAVAQVREEIVASTLERMGANARVLSGRGLLRDGLSAARARDIMAALLTPELFELLVTRQGWTTAQYARFIGESLAAALLPAAH